MIPDALMIPEERRFGKDALSHGIEMAKYAESTLGADYDGGERAHIRTPISGKRFATKSPHDTIFFAKTHPRSGHSRYRWVEQEDGTMHGFLVDDAKDDGLRLGYSASREKPPGPPRGDSPVPVSEKEPTLA